MEHHVNQYSFLPRKLRHEVTRATAIGEGSFGQVYLLENKINHKEEDPTTNPFQYVLKRVSIRNTDTKQKAAAVEEALMHRNICNLYDFFVDGVYL